MITTINSSIVPLLIDDIDTDQIIPARFLKATDRKGFGENLFRDWRYDSEGNLKEDFPLNQAQWHGEILLVGRNFGCGSSREHAAWALKDYGFTVIVSTYFADIFKGNALNNGLLPVQISQDFYDEILEEIKIDNHTKLLVDLNKQDVMLRVSGVKEHFEISPFKKECLMKGLDDLDFLIEMREEIEEFLTVDMI